MEEPWRSYTNLLQIRAQAIRLSSAAASASFRPDVTQGSWLSYVQVRIEVVVSPPARRKV